MEVDESEAYPKAPEKVFSQDSIGPPTFDLEQYCEQYTGIIKYERLEYIAKSCPTLSEKAYELAIKEIKASSHNVSQYRSFQESLRDSNPSNPLSQLDQEWIDRATRESNEWMQTIEQRMRSSQGVPNKTAEIYSDWAKYYVSVGRLTHAQRALLKQSDTLGYNQEDDGITCRLVTLAVISRTFSYARGLLSKSFGKHPTDDALYIYSIMGALYGISLLAIEQYEEATGALLKIPTGNDQLEHVGEIASGTDLAVYTALCGMASLSRPDLKYLATKDVTFGVFCEEAQHIRELVRAFVDIDYKKFFTLWNKHENDFRLDMFIGPHVPALYQTIKSRAMKQYLDVYSRVGLEEMADVFMLGSVENLIRDLRILISTRKLNVRIDCENGVVELQKVANSSEVFGRAKKLAEDFSRDSRMLLWALETSFKEKEKDRD